MGATRLLLVFLLAVATGPRAQGSVEERMFAAIDQGKELVAEGLLLQAMPNLDARNASGETVLHRAVEKDMKELVQAIVKAGANLRARSASGETVLHLAAMHTDPAQVAFLLASGADPKARNDEGETPLHWAALSGNAPVASLLLEHGTDPDIADIRGNRPLHAAADSGNMAMVKFILSRSSDPRAKNRAGHTAEDVANERSRPEIARLLTAAGPGRAPSAGASNYRTNDIDDQQPAKGH